MQFEILIDKKENPRQCTIHPLKDRSDFSIRYFGKRKAIPAFTSEVLLHVDGDSLNELSQKKPVASIGLIDCTWKKVPSALARLEAPLPRLVRIPEGFLTAYPRRNKEGKDPLEGLATIEALFIAAAFFGNWDESLLKHYHFKDDFLKINKLQWERYGISAK